MQPSPYTPGEIARMVPGRVQQLADFDERLSLIVDLGRFIGRIRIDHAPRGFGKTSLLREYQRRAQARGLLTIWITAGEGGLVEQITAGIAHEISGWSESAKRQIVKHLDSLTLRIGLPSVASLDATIRPAKTTPGLAGSRDLEDVIRATAAAKENRGLVILIDEVQAADPTGLRSLAYAWQHLQSEGTGIPAAVFAAGLPNAASVIAAAVTFSERFAYRQLLPLRPVDEEYALVIPAKELNVTWEQDALEEALAIAKGNPYVIQLIGDSTWTAAGRPSAGELITAGAVKLGRKMMEADLESMFRARLANASPGEKRFISAMAELGDGAIRRADIAKLLGKESSQLSIPRARLLGKGFIQAGTRGTLEFTVPGFAEYVRNLKD